MAEFKYLSSEEEKTLDELLEVADKVLDTNSVVLTKGSSASNSVGLVIGGTAGAVLAGSGVAGLIGGGGAAAVGVTGLVGSAATATGAIALAPVVIPVAIVALFAGAVLHALFGDSEKEEEIERQKAYLKAYVERINAICEKIEETRDKLESTNKRLKSEVTKLTKKLAEYGAMYAALRKKYEELTENLEAA